MNSTDVYDPKNEDNSAHWSSSEGEEHVIEISSHSRILISPRKDRRTLCVDKSQHGVGKRKTSRTKQQRGVAKCSQSRRRFFRPQNAGTLRTTMSDKHSNNCDSVSESDSDEDIVSSQEDRESSVDSDSSFEADVETTPGYRRMSRRQPLKGAMSDLRMNPATTSRSNSMQSHSSPTVPWKEMEELKATLKKLARHDLNEENFMMQKAPDMSSAVALREYLTAADTVHAIASTDQDHPTEYMDTKALHESLLLESPTKTTSKSIRKTERNTNKTRDDSSRTSGSSMESGSERISFNKVLYSIPPPPFGGSKMYTARLPPPFQKSRIAASADVSKTGVQDSRAVLSALKALKEKIVRLEEEREKLMQEVSHAKLVTRKREAELASREKTFAYELSQAKETARAAYDALRCDREELKLQLIKSEKRRKATQVELQHFREVTTNLQAQLQISESHCTRINREMKESESDNKHVVNQLRTELVQVQQEKQTAIERSNLLENQLQRESSDHAECKERLNDSEQAMVSISQLNETLAVKVMEAINSANQVVKKNKKVQQQVRPSTLLRPTAASRASAVAVNEAASRRKANSTASQGSTGVYSARTLKKKTTTGTATKKSKQAKDINNATLLREANHGNSVQPSFSFMRNTQDALRQCDSTSMMPTLLSSAEPATITSTPSQQQSKSEADAAAFTPTLASSNAAAATPSSATDVQRQRTEHIPSANEEPNVSMKADASPMQSPIMKDLCTAVACAEKEVDGLNKRYQDLVAQVEARSNRRGLESHVTSSSHFPQDLSSLLEELETKATQLNVLKQVYQQFDAQQHRCEYLMHVKNDAKNKESGRSVAAMSNLAASD